ncbi:MAG: vitamin K epoxide reductase family protein [Nanoarchaeota archaeon]|nr:vitamin K epoxide reductase family protein [Nanoarchaeota archaeon]
MITALRIFAVLGMIVSIYAWIVKVKAERGRKYNPLCDIKSNISCTKAITSKYGNLLKILPNHVLGLLFYVSVFVVSFTKFNFLIFFMAIPAMIMTIMLAYVSFFIQRNFCLLCISSYIINIAVLVLSYMQ